jgi:hypothetical protein
MKKAAVLVLVGVTLSGCYWPTRNPVANGAIIGGVTGAAIGGVTTGTIGGAAVGAGVGAVTGALIGAASR